MKRGNPLGEVDDMAIAGGILEDRAKDLRRVQRPNIILDDLDPQRHGAGADDGDGLGVAEAVDKKGFRLGLRHPLGHGHRLGRRRRLVQQAGVCHVKARQVADHGLEVEQRLQPALRDLGLVGRVGGVPGRVLQNVPLDGGGCHRAVIALPDQAGHHPVLRADLFHLRQQFMFRKGRPRERLRLADGRGHGLVDQLVQGPHADSGQHLCHLGRRGADVAAVGEVIGVIVGGRKRHGVPSCASGPTGFLAKTRRSIFRRKIVGAISRSGPDTRPRP